MKTVTVITKQVKAPLTLQMKKQKRSPAFPGLALFNNNATGDICKYTKLECNTCTYTVT